MDNNLIQLECLKPFGRFIYTIGILPTSYIFSMTYEEQIIWFCNYLEQVIKPAINNNALATKELQDKYLEFTEQVNQLIEEMQSYLENYFDNLDVQEEINNKLDDMAQDGTLDDIIAQYIQLQGVIHFDTLTQMKQGTNLVNGSYVETSGFYEQGDGGGAKYKIRQITNQDVVDEMTIISLYNQELIAELIYNSEINICQLGAKRWVNGEQIFDNKQIIDKAISLFPYGGKIIVPIGKFFTSGEHIIDKTGKITITGYGSAGFNDGSCIGFLSDADYGFWIRNENFDTNIMVGHEISNLHLIGNNTLGDCIIVSDHFGSILKDLYITDVPKGNAITLYNYEHFTEGTTIQNCHIRFSLNGIKVKRNLNSLTATESFFNTKIINCIMSLDYDNSIFINLNEYEQQTEKTLICYSWEVSVTIWYQNVASNNFVIRVGNSAMLSGNVVINVDGLHPNQCLIRNSGSGYTQLKGTINYNASNGIPSIDATHFIDLVHEQGGETDGYNRGRLEFEGAKIFNGERLGVEKANSVIYSSNWLPTSAVYRLMICEDADGIKRTNVYLITTGNTSITPLISKLTNFDSYFYPRPIGGAEQGIISAGNGAKFEIYCGNIQGTVPMYFTLEML